MTQRAFLGAGLSVVVLWASAFPAIQVAAPVLGAAWLSVLRLAVAALALLTAAPFLGVRVPRAGDLGRIVACGFFGMTAYQLLLNAGEEHVPAGTASMIVAAAPLVSVAVARLLLAERIGTFTVLGSAVALAGVALVCLARTGASFSTPVVVVVAAMVVQGIYHPLQKPLLRTYTGLEVATYAMVAGTVMTLPALLFAGGGPRHASAEVWASAIFLGVFPSALGFVLWAYAVARLPLAVSTSLLYLVPPAAVLIAWGWLGQLPTALELCGGVIVIAGVVLLSQGGRIARRRRRRSRPVSPAPSAART
ncbi:MAG TPA: DMT family transporter [Actinocatenispora sp.]